MTRPTTDDTRPDTIRDAFEAILALLQMLIARKFSGLYTSAVRLGVEVGEQLDITHPHSGKSLLALRDLIQRAAEEHNRRTSAAAADMPAERLREMRERCERATPGPWFVNRYDCDGGEINWQVQQEPDPCEVIANITDDEPKRAKHDAAFVAHAREDLPAAIAEIERLNRLVVATANADPSWVERCTTQAAEIERLATALQAERAAWQEASGADSPGHLTAALKARRARLTAVLCERTSDLADEVRALRGERDQSAHTIAALQAERESENEGARRLMARVAALESELAARPAPAADASLEARAKRAAQVYDTACVAPDDNADEQAWLAVVRAVDASRPAAPEVDAEDLWADYRTERPHMTIADRVAFLAGVEAGRRTSDASRPGLTEEQAQIARAEPVIAAWLDYFAAMDRQHKSGTAADARTVRELRAKVEAMSPSVTDIVYFVALARHRARGEVGPAPAGEERPAKPCPAFFGLAGSVYGAQFGDRCDACRRTRAEHGASQ